MSGLILENRGTKDVTVDHIHVVLVGGRAIDSPAGIGIPAGNAETYLFDSQSLQSVDSVSFVVHGSTEELVVLPTQETGRVPGGEDGATKPLTGNCSSACPSGQICCFVWGVGGPSTGVNQCLAPDPQNASRNGCPPNL
jgi:hypothetical protein